MTDTVVTSLGGRRVTFEPFYNGGMLVIEDIDLHGRRMSAQLDKKQARRLARAILVAMRAPSPQPA